jgi:flagellar protein FlaI
MAFAIRKAARRLHKANQATKKINREPEETADIAPAETSEQAAAEYPEPAAERYSEEPEVSAGSAEAVAEEETSQEAAMETESENYPAPSYSEEPQQAYANEEPPPLPPIREMADPLVEPMEQARHKEKLIRIPLPKVFTAVESREDVLAKLRDVQEKIPLVTTTWKGVKYVVTTATIRFNELANQLVYQIEEPVISDEAKDIVQKTLQLLQERLEVDPSKMKAKAEVYGYVDQKINEVWDYLGVKLSGDEELKAKYYLFRDTIGYGKIESLMRDPNIEDISCDGIGVPVYIFHRNPLYSEIPTNITFESKEELDSFVMKLSQKAGRTISVATPLLDATLPDGSRLQVTYGTDIARRGSNFSIRKFFRLPFTVVDIINYGTADPLTLAYLWLAIDEQLSVLISGTTAVGKTTFLNSVSQFIRPNLKIVSIEDTAELQLTNVNWVPQIARSGYGPKKYGEVTMFDLLKAALRQRPDYLIVGEVRGREADVMFHAMATGHPSLATIHADNLEAVIDRLTTRPISLPMSLLENLDIIVFLDKGKKEGRMIRRVGKIVEVEGYDRKTGELRSNVAFEWVPSEDKFESYDSYNLAKIAHKLGWNVEKITAEVMRRANVISWMRERNISKFREVAGIINLYYTNPMQLDQMMHAH